MKTAEIATLFEIAHHKQCLIQVDYKAVTDMRELNSNRFFNKIIIRMILIITKKTKKKQQTLKYITMDLPNFGCC